MAGLRLLISASPGEARYALCDADGRLVHLTIERSHRRAERGDVVVGRVVRAMPGSDAVLVDIGAERPGFLPIDAIATRPAEGAAVTVQIVQPPHGEKGAKLTGRPALAGRLLVHTPESPELRLSRRLDAARARELRARIAAAAPGSGFVLRTAAAEAEADALAAEARRLVADWAAIAAKTTATPAPATIHRGADTLSRLAAEHGPALDAVVCDDHRMAARVREAFAGLPATIKVTGPRTDLFEVEGIAAQIDAALVPEVALPGGGLLRIEATAALVAVDVDAAGRAEPGGAAATAMAVNLEAVAELARQLVLRNLSGQIVVDLLPVKGAGRRKRLLAAARDAAQHDPRLEVQGFGPLGLLELVRVRHDPALAEQLRAPCPCCGTGGAPSAEAMALEALRGALRHEAFQPGSVRGLVVPAAVAALFDGALAAARREAESRLGRTLVVTCGGEGRHPTWHIDTREGMTHG